MTHTSPQNAESESSKLDIYLRLLAYVKPYWHYFLVSIIGFWLYSVTQPMFAAMMEYAVDSIQTDRRDAMIGIPLAFVGIIAIRGLGGYLGNYYIAKVSNNIVHTLRCQLFDKYTTLPISFFDNNASGHLVSRINYNVEQMTRSATDAVKVIVREGLTVTGLLIYLFYINWKLSLVFVGIAPIIALIVTYTNRRFRIISRRLQTAVGDFTHIASELISGHRVVRSFGGEEYEKNRFHSASKYSTRQSMKMVQTSAIHTPVLQLIVALALSTLIFLALNLMGDASPGEFIAYIAAAALIPKPVRQLSEVNAGIQRGITAAETLFETLDEPAEPDNGSYSVDRAKGQLEFDHLSFAYNGADDQVLQDISFKAEPGQIIALVGHSGSGKSTLANLIPRFYDYKEGAIRLDGVELKEYTLANLRKHIALVTQHVTLFNDTIENNIAYGALVGTPREAVIRAATAANAMDFINELPDGLDTLIGENGLKLSGGQRQRLAIARAILKDAPLLILDEATSALDTESERKIQEALEVVMRGRTTIVIAHRLSTIENADLILVMHKGHIAESGDHISLLQEGGYYAQLYNIQFKDKETETPPSVLGHSA